MAIYQPDKVQKPVITRRKRTKRGKRVGDNFKRPNSSGSYYDQLADEHCGRSDHYDGTLVVLVGHFADKLERLISLYKSSVDLKSHHCIVAYNGNPDKIGTVSSVLPHNVIHKIIQVDNTGWDLKMYSRAVLRYAFDQYFFLNDDITVMKPGWLDEYEDKISKLDMVGLQGVGHYRTTYYGMKREAWLAVYASVMSRLVTFNVRAVNPHLRQRMIKHDAVLAYAFEGCNMWMADRLGYKHGFLRDRFMMMDTLCRSYRKCLRCNQAKKVRVYAPDQPLTVDYVVNYARANDQ